MIKHWLATGDSHGLKNLIDRIEDAKAGGYCPEETAFIVLGDLGANFYLNDTDRKWKEKLEETGFYVYAVRGNHEARPQSLPDMEIIWDKEVQGAVYVENSFRHIHYFTDYGDYIINGFNCLVIGGAYSVDKYYRLAGRNENTKSWTGWFKDEQLTELERTKCKNFLQTYQNHYDFVFTHTCPMSWVPTDLFMPIVDQSTVDNTMEEFLEEIKNNYVNKDAVWLFGHYHADRLERPKVQQMYHTVEQLDDIYNRWQKDELEEWWLPKSPFYYEGQN